MSETTHVKKVLFGVVIMAMDTVNLAVCLFLIFGRRFYSTTILFFNYTFSK